MSIFFAGNMVRQRHGIFNPPFSYDPDALAYFATAGISSSNVTPSSYDQAASFNGSNQYLISSSFTSIGFNSFSVSAWINPSVLVNQYQMIFTGETAGDFNVNVTPTGQLSVGQVGLTTELLSSVTISVNQWSHVVATADGVYLKIYINGVNVGTVTRSYAYPINSLQINGWVGARYLFNGSISAVGYWSAALNLSQINALYNGGIGLPYNKLPITLTFDLVSYWALNETTGASSYVDSTTTGNNLTPYNTPTNSVSPIALSTLPTQNLINNFVIGIKQLGLWSSMVCWPLRSSQNASSTQTAYSLGGLGSYNGSLVNNPNWQSNGLVLNGTNQYVNTSLNQSGTYSATTCAVVNEISSATNQWLISIGAANGSPNFGLNAIFLNYPNSAQMSGSMFTSPSTGTNVTPNTFNMASFSTYGNGTINQLLYLGSSLVGSVPVSGNYIVGNGNMAIGTLNISPSSYTAGLIPFAAYFSVPFNTSIYALYKSTLGVGLAMP